ncbi:MAG: helix-turn-helix transcriptional regulator [Actinomycetia bacterium]|nr:helix-turn-helix transcriptional regulator [Actinomycetes bacterium]
MSDTTGAKDSELAGFPHSTYCEYFQGAIELIGRRWSASILRALFAGKERFTDIALAVPGLSHRLLTERLEELTEADLISIEPGMKHGTYHLTERGADLRPFFHELEAWNARWYEDRSDDTRTAAV